MKSKVWEVKMGDMDFPAAPVSIKNVRANTVKEAIAKAEKAEKEFVKSFNEDEGENTKPDKVTGVRFLCDLDDD